MHLTISLSAKRVAIVLAIAVILLTGISTAIQWGKYVFDYRESWTRMFNLDREMNIPTWFSAMMLAGCGVMLSAIAAEKKKINDGYYQRWRHLGIIFFWLALDEVVGIHEILIIPALAQRLNLPGFWTQIWVIPASIAVIWLIWHYWDFIWSLPRLFQNLLIIAGIIYISGALGLEMVGGAYAKLNGQQNLTYALLATVEEMMEMSGLVVFIYGLLRYIHSLKGQLTLNIKVLA